MEQLTDDLTPAERDRLALWALRLAYGDKWTPAGSFARAHVYRLEKAIKAADARAVHERKVASQQAARLAAEAYLAGKGSLNQLCETYGINQRTLVRNLSRLRKTQAETNNQHE